ncbi:helix-turn-helix domain-containing protein [Lentilactobacillus sunkii]|uniref:DNA-binding protein n=1 Tax=Lentilactobacillus sunkii DSM 19904 TaxID=1423808 RepID=A0A0R1L722_9LACO|nr:helix-turn-helix transcriptional regulator [Lentilactobacillus sunkii]KRK88018.1 DNA-binding protein [Lentilactobacillus sunkii DSM 19904]
MRVNIGPVLVSQRKKRGITQQQLADFIGVSKGAVSKWETGQSYPDISLLPALASYFDLRIDDLMDYEPQLSAKEIQNIYRSLKKSFTTEPGDKVLTTMRSFVRRYYACYPFLQQMGMLLLNHFDLLPGKDMQDKTAKYVSEAQQLFIRVRKNSDDTELKLRARNMEAYSLLLLNKPTEVLSLLGTTTPEYIPTENLIASAYQMQGKTEQAQAVYQSAMYQASSVGMSYFTNYLVLLNDDPDRFGETYQRGRAYADVFALASLNPAVYLNFLLSAVMGFAHQQKADEVFAVLTDYTDTLADTKFPLVLHGDAYFDKIDSWLDHLDIGSETPRNSEMVEQQLIGIVLNDPTLAPFRNDERWAPLADKLKEINQNAHE